MSKGTSANNGRVMANDGMPAKLPQIKSPSMKVNGGYVPKTPITTGSKKS